MTPEQLVQIIPILIGAILIQGAALSILSYLVLKSKGEPPKIEEVFTVYKTGLLIKHIGNHDDDTLDNDIITGMLTAVQDFIKESFCDRDPSDLKKMEFGEKRLFLERGDYIYLAVVYTGDANRKMQEKITRIIDAIETIYRKVLYQWDGDLRRLKSIEEITRPLIDGTYS
jgi:OOP family OmpA-OmpF porin